MRSSVTSNCSQRREAMVAVQVAVTMTALVGVLALVLDSGMLLLERRHAQSAADAAALAGAAELLRIYYPTDLGHDLGHTARDAAADYLNNNYTSAQQANLANISINVPPSSNSITQHRTWGFIEVSFTYNQPRYFSTLFGSGSIPITARAVAEGKWAKPRAGVIVLDPSARSALDISGGGSFTVSGASIQVDSSNSSAFTVSGGGTITATEADVYGGYSGNGNFNVAGGHPITGVPPIPDPLAYLPAPTVPPAGRIEHPSSHVYILHPGSYGGGGSQPNLPNFGNNDIVTFKQASDGNGGIYYFTQKGFNSNGATLAMDVGTTGGIMLYNAGTGSSDAINIAGNSSSSVILSGLTRGPYKDILFFQARNASENLSITGNGTFQLTGTIYAAAGTINVTGNGTAQANPMIAGSQMVAGQIKVAGNGYMVVNYYGGLVAPQRILTLVE